MVQELRDRNPVSAEELEQLRERLGREGTLGFRMATDSMSPCIRPGDLVLVSPIREPVRKFDIIVFWSGKILVCHYVAKLRADGAFEALGINSSHAPRSPEPRFHPPQAILGKAISHELAWHHRLRILLPV